MSSDNIQDIAPCLQCRDHGRLWHSTQHTSGINAMHAMGGQCVRSTSGPDCHLGHADGLLLHGLVHAGALRGPDAVELVDATQPAIRQNLRSGMCDDTHET